MTDLAVDYDCAVVGGGPAGLAAALALARCGFHCALIAPPAGDGDRRTFALFPASERLLAHLGIADALTASAPLRAIRLIDDRGGLLRAPEVLFQAAEVGLDSFGANVAHAALVAALEKEARRERKLTMIAAGAAAFDLSGSEARVTLSDGTELSCRLVVGADGARSSSRRAAQIATKDWAYDQTAIVTRFRHSRPHCDVSTEFHRAAGPLTTVPLPANESALVWVERPAVAQRLMGLDDEGFVAALEARLMGLLGALSAPDPRQAFALKGMTVETAGARHVALVGEAAHVFPPIGAQGLNLGLRDVGDLIDCVCDARRNGHDIGGRETLDAYSRLRAGDIAGRTFTVDLLDKALITSLMPVQLARGLGLHVIKAAPWLRQRLMHVGLGPDRLPRLMQPTP